MGNQHTKKKTATQQRPKSCLEALQPSFSLFAQDNLAPLVINYWIQLAETRGVPAAKIASARKRLAEMEEFRRLNPLLSKLPT